MRFIGIHVGHDAGIVIINEFGQVEFFAQSERYSPRDKKDQNLSPIFEAFPNLEFRSGDVITFSAINIGQKNDILGHDRRLVQSVKGKYLIDGGSIPIHFVIGHHLAHALASWCFRSDDKSRMFIAYDGAGPDADGTIRSYLIGRISASGFNANFNSVNIPSSIPVGCLLGHDSAGKVMGLAGYKVDAPKFVWTDENAMKMLDMHRDQEPIYPTLLEPLTEKNMDFIAGFYKWIIDQIWEGVKGNIEKFGSGAHSVVVGGGTSLALELNTKIHNMVGDVVFGPPINDCGEALGAAAFGYFHHKKKWPRIFSPSLVALQKRLPKIGPQEPELIAKKLAKGDVIGLLRGQAEAGPRSLGFRSLLASAGNPDNLKLVSQEIKEREFYRPLAPIVTSEQFERFFDGPKGEYMQYRVTCNAEAKRLLPVVVHRDASSRPQVVCKDKDPWMHRLLVSYGELTGVECLINTSLNKAGMPICNTYEDAEEDMKGKPVQLVSIPHPAHRFSDDYEEPKIYV